MRSIELRQQRKRLAEQMRALLDAAEAENRDLTAEEQEQWDRMDADVIALTRRIEREERLADEEARGREVERATAGGQSDGDRPSQPSEEETRAAFWSWVRNGLNALSPEHRAIMQRRYQALTAEQRALAVGTGAAGGFAVDTEFERSVQTNMLAFGEVMNVTTRVPTETGAQLLVPTADDVANKGAILAENTQVTEQDPAFGQVPIDSYTYTSKLVRVSYQLLQDAAFPLESWLAERLGERLGRILNEHLTTGTGTAQPHGLVTGSSVGKTGTTGQTTTVIYDDLVDLEHSVDPAYRRRARWMFHDTTLKALKKIKDSQQRPLWLPGLAVREPDTILGYPYTINQDVAVMAANAKSILFGDLSKYWWRDVRGVTLLRLEERYADFLQVGFLAFTRKGGRLIDAGTDPVKHYANSAT